MFIAILEAIGAIPTIMGYVDKWAPTFIGWYVAFRNQGNGPAIQDALHQTLKAPNTKEARIAAAKAWQDAITRPVVTG